MPVILIVMLTGCLSSMANSPTTSDATFWSELRKLSQQSRTEGKKCDALFKPVEEKAGRPVDDKPEAVYFQSKETALQVLLGLQQYPGQPASTSKAYMMIRDSLPANSDVDLQAMTFIGSCSSIRMFKLYKWLIESTRHYPFSKPEQNAVRDSVLSYLKKNMNGPLPLIGVMIDIALLRQASDSGLLSIGADRQTDLIALRKESDSTRERARSRSSKWSSSFRIDQMDKLPISEKREIASTVQLDLKDANTLQKKLEALVAGLTP